MSETTTPPTEEHLDWVEDRARFCRAGCDASEATAGLVAEIRRLRGELARAHGAVHLASVWDSLASALDRQADALETDAGCVAKWLRDKAGSVRAALGPGGAA